MQQPDTRLVYDLEIAVNRTILGIKAPGQPPEHVVIDAPLSGDTVASIMQRLGGGVELTGYNNTGFDTYILKAALQGAEPAYLHQLAQDIITSKAPAWQVARSHGVDRCNFNELDLMHYTPRGRLKDYEGRLGLAIVDLPFDPHQPITDAQLPEVLRYLEHDLAATETLRQAVEGDVQARLVLERMFDVPGLTKKTAANVAATIIVTEYLRANPEVDLAYIKASAQRMRNCSFTFYVPEWVRAGIRGTQAERIADAIDGTEFSVKDGVRQPLTRPWPELIRLSEEDGLEAAFGLGGVHTKDSACQYSGVSYDVASLYPHIIMHPDCTPTHLEEAQFHAIYGRLIERRLQAKKAGDKATSNALKLVLNSAFGAYNFGFSQLYSPDAFLSITVSGQLCLLALAERVRPPQVQDKGVSVFVTAPSSETRVVSLNTDSIALQVAPGDEKRVEQVVGAWEQTFGFQMERTEVLAHRGLNINSYIEVVRESDGPPEIKSKGLLAHDPGISANHDALVVRQAIGQQMLDGTSAEAFIRAAAERREILLFTEMRSAPGSGLRLGGQPIGKLIRVYRSTRADLPSITKDATDGAGEQQLEGGFAYLPDIHWPVANDVDVDWYVQQAQLLLTQTDVPYSPQHNALAQQLQALGLEVLGVGGAATELRKGHIDTEAVAKGTDKNPRNYSGDRCLAVSLTKGSGVLALPVAVTGEDSLVLRFGTDVQALGEIHDRQRLGKAELKRLRKAGVKVQEKGWLKVYDLRDGVKPLLAGQPVSPPPKTKSDQSEQASLPAQAEQVTNDDFLCLMFGDDLDDAFVCSNTTPPDTDDEIAKAGMWGGGPIEHARDLYKNPQRQNYTCVSTFRRDAAGIYYRQSEFFQGLSFLVLDDIGTKVQVDPRTLGFSEPTAIIETSPGNHQWFYRLSEPVRDVSVASFLTKQVLATPVQGHLMTDQGAKGITRLCKLPQGRNLKLALGQPWQNRLVSWRPELAYSAREVAGWFGQSLDQVPQISASPAATADQSGEHPLIQALHAAGLLKSAQQKGSGWWDITCHQHHLHTKAVDDGTAVKVKADGSWTMRCLHGHCADLTPRDLYRYLIDNGHNPTPPQACIYVARIDRARLPFALPQAPDPEDFSFLDPDDGGAGEEVDYPDPEEAGGGGLGSVGGSGSGLGGVGKPVIYVDPGLLPHIMRQCANLLDDVVFKRGTHLVRIGRAADLQDGLSRMGSQPIVFPVTRNWMVRELTERAEFKRWDLRKKDYKVVDCPGNIASALEDGSDDVTFRPLTALANAPFLRVDGSVCDVPGYDDETGIYYAPTLSFPQLPSQPNRAEARAALDELCDLVKQFPFANAVSRSVFLADVLTALARPTLPKSPVVLYTASMAGSGKTLMASIANLIAYGHATTHPWPNGNEEELKKVFTSVLIAGDPVVVFDNLPNGVMVKSAALSQFVTSDDYADRKLGESERLKFRNRTRVVLTGNNVTLASDNARRTIVCELQLQVESLKDRQVLFEHPNLAGYIKHHRPRLIVAALTVLRAYALHPQPLNLTPLDSFEDWSWRVREALVWLGEEDPVGAVDYGNDGAPEIGQVFAAIHMVARSKVPSRDPEFRASDLAIWASGNFALRDALEQAGCADPVSSSKVGYWLRAHKNRIAGGLKLQFRQVHGGRQPNSWQLAPAECEHKS